MAREIAFTLNGNRVTVLIRDHWTLLYLLREAMGLPGTKEGCGSGECGACTVVVDGVAVNACLYLAAEVEDREVLTIEGMAADDGTLHPIQQAFVDRGAIQCGFCSPGMILSAKALLDENPNPTDEEIKHALAGNMCRCTGYVQIINAVRSVAQSEEKQINVVAWQADTTT